MFQIYDNWERLAAAVLRREELWQLFHEQSRSPSICSESSDFSSSSYLDDDDLRSAESEVKVKGSTDLIAAKEIVQYAPGQSVRNVAPAPAVNMHHKHQTLFWLPFQRMSSRPNGIILEPIKVVLLLDFTDDKMRSKAMMKVSRLSGVESIASDPEEKS